MSLDAKIAVLAEKYLPLACEWLREAIRIPADTHAENPNSGMSNNEGPRLHYLMAEIIKCKCVENKEDVTFDEYGNLCWFIEDTTEEMPSAEKKVVYFDGHTDTVDPLPQQWTTVLGGGVHAFNGLLDASKVDRAALEQNVGWVPKEEEYENCIWGRGCADQLAGVISQMMGTKIMLELKAEGAMKNVIVRSVGTVAEEDNDGAGPMYIMRKGLNGKGAEFVPDCFVFTEGTGDSTRSGLGIYRGQRGRMQIEVEVQGSSCHGSMPHMGKNPLEWGSRILVEATEQVEAGEGILDHEFLGKGTRTASWAKLDTPSDCAVPDRFTFRFDRRMTVGETPAMCVEMVEILPSIAKARAAGLTVTVSVPHYTELSWKGYNPDNDQIYMGWETPEDHPAIVAATKTYSQVITPNITEEQNVALDNYIKPEPHVGRWIFSTDGVGVPLPVEHDAFEVPAHKRWIEVAGFKYPAMLGLGAGSEQNTHSCGEVIHQIELQHACAWMARFPSQFAETAMKK